MALNTTGALYRLVNGHPGEYYLIVGKVNGRSAYEGAIVSAGDLRKWIESWQQRGKSRFVVCRITPVVKYVKGKSPRQKYKKIKYEGAFFL